MSLSGQKKKKSSNTDDTQKGNEEEDDDIMLALFDRICFSWGDQDAIQLLPPLSSKSNSEHQEQLSFCYLEIQELSFQLARQLRHRFRPDVCIIDGRGHAVAEAVLVLACMRIGVPFCPVETVRGRFPTALVRRVYADTSLYEENDNGQEKDLDVCAILCAETEVDPGIALCHHNDIHRILRVDHTGNLCGEQLAVPNTLPDTNPRQVILHQDALYILPTSGTTRGTSRLVVGSKTSTARRLAWERHTFAAVRTVARRAPLVFVDGLHELLGSLLRPETLLVAARDPSDFARRGVSLFFEPNLVEKVEQVTLLPSQLQQLLLWGRNVPNWGKDLRRIIVSGEVCSASLYHQICKRFPRVQFVNLYGQTETTGEATCAILSDLSQNQAVVNGVVCVGNPILGYSICLAAGDTKNDDSGKRRRGSEDEIHIAGANTSCGYLVQGATGSTVTPVGTFLSGDMGFAQSSSWYIRGRVDDMEKVHGILTSPQDVESALMKVFPKWDQVAAAFVDGKTYALTKDATSFDRDRMCLSRCSWNVIPYRVFSCTEIPTRTEGVEKVDRRAVESMIRKELKLVAAQEPQDRLLIRDGSSASEVSTLVCECVSVVLDIRHADGQKSFVSLGGSSASAVSLLYHLQDRLSKNIHVERLTAVDILDAKSLQSLVSILTHGVTTSTRGHSRQDSDQIPFVTTPSTKLSKWHLAVCFGACVDGSPTPCSTEPSATVFVGCQGGIVMRVCTLSGNIVSWVGVKGGVQSDIVLHRGKVYVFSHHPKGGRVECFDESLRLRHWETMFEGGVKYTPVLHDDLFLIQEGLCNIACIDPDDGKLLAQCTLPSSVCAPPLSVSVGCVYFSADISCDAAVVVPKVLHVEDSSFKTVNWHYAGVLSTTEASQTIGPVHHQALALNKRCDQMLVCDSWGSVHYLVQISVASSGHARWLLTSSLALSSGPLTSPVRETNSKEQAYLIGGYDGTLYRIVLPTKQQKGSKVVLRLDSTMDIDATIFARPLCLPDGSCVVTTTAGDVVRVRITADEVQTVARRNRVRGEIWSDPVLVDWNNDSAMSRIAYGARDSRLHLVDI